MKPVKYRTSTGKMIRRFLHRLKLLNKHEQFYDASLKQIIVTDKRIDTHAKGVCGIIIEAGNINTIDIEKILKLL